MGPIVIMFGKRSLFDCINKADPTVAAGLLGSLLGCNRESDLHLVRFYTLATSKNISMEWSELDCAGVSTKYVWQRDFGLLEQETGFILCSRPRACFRYIGEPDPQFVGLHTLSRNYIEMVSNKPI